MYHNAKFEERESVERFMRYEKEFSYKNQNNNSLILSTPIREADMSDWINKQSGCQSLIVLSLCATKWTEQSHNGAYTYSIISLGLLGKTFTVIRNLP